MARKKTEQEEFLESVGGSCIIPYVTDHRYIDYDDPGEYATCMTK